MSVRKRVLPSGTIKWQASIGSGKDRVREQFSTKAEATRWENQQISDRNAGNWRPNASKVRLRDLEAPFKQLLERRLKAGERMSRFHKDTLARHVNHYILGGKAFRRRDGTEITFNDGLGDLRLKEITPERVSRFLHDVLATGLTVKTTNEVHNSLLVMLNFAVDRKDLASNPAADRKFEVKRKKCNVPPKILVKRLVEEAPEPLSTAILLASLSGIRAGEQRALTWGDVDFAKATLSVDKTLNRWSEDEGRGAKTDAGNRTIPLADEVVAALKRLRLESTFRGCNDLIFPNHAGKPVQKCHFYTGLKTVFGKVMAKWPEEEDQPRSPRWHDLRHFAASTWIEAKLDPLAIQTYIGHADFSTTMRIYGHLFETVKHHEFMDRLAGEIFGSTRPPLDGPNLPQQPSAQ